LSIEEGEELRRPRVVVNIRGIYFLAFLFIISVLMIYFGNLYRVYGLLLWGLVILVSSILALIPIAARIAIPRMIAERAREEALRAAIEEKIKKALEKEEKEEVKEVKIQTEE